MASRGAVPFLVSFIFSVVSTYAQNVCDPRNYQNYNGPALPFMPDQTTWRMEINIVNKQYTMDSLEFYDYTNNKYASHNWWAGNHTFMIFKFDTDELIYIKFPSDQNAPAMQPSCTISNLTTSRMAFIVGNTMVSGKMHVPRPIDSLRLNTSQPIKYLGKKTLQNGVKCDVWEGCLQWDQGRTTNKVTWYFSDIGSWYTAMGKIAVPELVSVIGNATDPVTNMPRSFHHEYVISDYRPYLSKGAVESFQIPRGVYCKNDVNTQPIPTIPDHYSFSAEIVEQSATPKKVSTIKEYYDQALRLTRYDYIEPKGSLYGHVPITRIHDFNTGVAYSLDLSRGNCSVSTIPKYGFDTTDSQSVSLLVRLRSPASILELDKANYSYVGQRLSRGIVCDVWVAQRTDWPPGGAGEPTTWEFYFSVDQESSISGTDVFSVPVQLSITSASKSIVFEYHFFEFNTDRLTFHNYDVTPCFDSSHKADFLLVLDGNYRNYYYANNVVFNRLVALSVMATASVSPIRITKVQVSFNTTGLLVTFSLLDKPSIKGDVSNPIVEPDLDGAIKNLRISLDAKNFTILINDPLYGGGFRNLLVNSYSYTRGAGSLSRGKRDTRADHITQIRFQKRPPTGLSTGSVAGVAVGSLVGGFVIGFVVVFIILKSKQPSGPISFTNPMKDMKE